MNIFLEFSAFWSRVSTLRLFFMCIILILHRFRAFLSSNAYNVWSKNNSFSMIAGLASFQLYQQSLPHKASEVHTNYSGIRLTDFCISSIHFHFSTCQFFSQGIEISEKVIVCLSCLPLHSWLRLPYLYVSSNRNLFF